VLGRLAVDSRRLGRRRHIGPPAYRVWTAATEVVGRLFATLAGDARDREQARGNAIVALSMMIGALTLTRIVSDSALSEEILARAREHLHRQLQPH
jgi:hypothetical protein